MWEFFEEEGVVSSSEPSVPGLDPRVHLLSGGDFAEVDGVSQGPFPVRFEDRAGEYRTRFPGNRAEQLGPLDNGEIGAVSEMLREFAQRLRHDIETSDVDASAHAYAQVVDEFAQRVFQSRTGPGYD